MPRIYDWGTYPETVRSGDKAAHNCFYNYGDARLKGSENWLSWSDMVQNDLDVYDYWKFFDGPYPRPHNLNEKASETEIIKRQNQQTVTNQFRI